MWDARHVRNPRGGEVTVSLFVSHQLPSAYSLLQTNVRRETRLAFLVMSDKKVVVLLVLMLVLLLVVAAIVVEESVEVLVGE